MADNLVFEESVQSVVDTQDFISKKWVYVNDNNNGNYSSQVVIDSTPLSNAGGWINWSEGYIMMPLLVQLSAVSGGASITNDSVNPLYTWAFKNGFWQMINSMTIEFNNQNVVQQTPFTNVFRSFKAMTSFSKDDVKNHGSSIGFFPDNAGSWAWSPDVASPNGSGLSNNRNAPSMVAISGAVGTAEATNANPIRSYISSCVDGVNSPTTGYGQGGNPTSRIFGEYAYNEGLLMRQEWLGYCPDITGNFNQGAINSASTCEAVYRSYCSVDTNCASWSVYAKLRLKDLHDYFEKMPLLKGSTIRFYLNTNQTLLSFTIADATSASVDVLTGGALTLPSAPSINGGLTCPLTIASNDVQNGTNSLPAGTYQLSVSIYQNQFSQTNKSVFTTALKSVRLYAPIYKFTPLKEQQYLSLAPTKKIKYNDIFQYQFSGIGSQSPFNFLVSNGISNIKSVLVVPLVSSSVNKCIGTAGSQTAISTLLSPLTTTGATPDPITLTNFNILISGVNLFLNNEQYDYEAFCQELAQSNQLNGGLTTGLASGLISQEDFSRGMRYYYGNCSRILPAEAGVSRSVQIVGQNASQVACDLMVFVEFEREITIDITTGARIA